MSNNAKVLRGQMRQIVKELFPEIVRQEFFEMLAEDQRNQLAKIHKLVRETLDRLEQKQKDIHTMLLRELSVKQTKE